MKIEVAGFGGMLPKRAVHLLPAGLGRYAANVKVGSGELRPLRQMKITAELPGLDAAQSVYLYGDRWLAFDEARTFCPSQVSGDAKSRVYGGRSDGGNAFTFCADDAVSNHRVTEYDLGVPAPDAAPSVEAAGGSGDPESRVYVFTLVSDLGEEGPPSPPSAIVEVETGDTVTVSGLNAFTQGAYRPVVAKRVYRTQTGASSTEYQFVAEVDAADASYVDAVANAELGELLPSAAWLPPPAGLTGLVSLPGNMLAGFKGHDVYICEPGYPHAWPIAHMQSFQHLVISLGVTGRTLVVLTEAKVYLLTVDDPAAAVPSALDGYLPCLSARGVANTPFGVVFPSTDGLYLVTAGASMGTNLTAALFGEYEWQTLAPEGFNAAFFDGYYLVFHQPAGGASRGMMLPLTSEAGALAGVVGFGVAALHLAPAGNRLYLAWGQGGKLYIAQWEGEPSATYRLSWTSAEFRAPRPVNMAAARLEADLAAEQPEQVTLPALDGEDGTLGRLMAGDALFGGSEFDFWLAAAEAALGELVFRLYADGRLILEKTVADQEPFTLPAGFEARAWHFEVSSRVAVSRVVIGTSMSEVLA